MYAMKSCVPIIWCLSSLNKLFTLLQSSKTLKSFSAAPQPISLYPVLAQEIISSHVQDFTFVLDVFHKVPDSPFLQSVWLSPDGNPALENREYNQCQQPQKEYTQYLSCRCYPKCVKLFQKKKKKKKDDIWCRWSIYSVECSYAPSWFTKGQTFLHLSLTSLEEDLQNFCLLPF